MSPKVDVVEHTCKQRPSHMICPDPGMECQKINQGKGDTRRGNPLEERKPMKSVQTNWYVKVLECI